MLLSTSSLYLFLHISSPISKLIYLFFFFLTNIVIFLLPRLNPKLSEGLVVLLSDYSFIIEGLSTPVIGRTLMPPGACGPSSTPSPAPPQLQFMHMILPLPCSAGKADWTSKLNEIDIRCPLPANGRTECFKYAGKVINLFGSGATRRL